VTLAGTSGTASEASGLTSRVAALRTAAGLPGADLRELVDAAIAELDSLAGALASRSRQAGSERAPSPAIVADRRTLQAIFQQVPVPVFVLGLDGDIRRLNAAAGDLLGVSPGYAAGKRMTTFIDIRWRAAVRAQLAAARSGGIRRFRCGLIGAGGVAESEIAVKRLSIRGDNDRLVAVATSAPPPAGRTSEPRVERREPASHDADLLAALASRLDAVFSVGRTILGSVSAGETVLLQRCARLLAGELADWVIVDIERGGEMRRLCVAGPDDPDSATLAQAIAGIDPPRPSAPWQVRDSGGPLLEAHAEDPGSLGPGPDGVPLLMVLRAGSVLCVPIAVGDQFYGVLTLARRSEAGPFALGDVGLAEELGEQLGIALGVHRTLRRRGEVAEALQAGLMPRKLPRFPGLELAAVHVPATPGGEIGADFYDAYPSGGGWGVAVGDVCGKGEAAAAVTAAARYATRVLARSERDPAALLRRVNDVLLDEELGGGFVTTAAGRLRWRGGTLHATLGSAGHPGPVLVRPEGRVRVVGGGGLPLGLFPDAEPAIARVRMRPGELLFFYTDGVTAARSPGGGYFDDQLTDELARLAGGTAAEVVSGIREALLEFCAGELRDDAAMLAVQAAEPPGE
jgi:PAS domain-containing protein